MKAFKIKIDEKSLYYGIKNPYEKGETATVSTPINQSKNKNKWHKDILELYNTSLSYPLNKIPDVLESQCIRKTTGTGNTQLDSFYIFKNLQVDGKKLNTKFSFAFYIKKEISKNIRNRQGQIVKNTHYGRLKFHYPITLKYIQDGFNINNKAVLESILVQNGGYAYVVRGFEVDKKNKSLNIITSIVGEKNILLTSVFIKKKGVGKKLLLNEFNYTHLEPSPEAVPNYVLNTSNVGDSEYFKRINVARTKNGKTGEEYVFNNIKTIIGKDIKDPFHTSKEYPTSPYDIEYFKGKTKRYLEVKSTSSSIKSFIMSLGELKFMKQYNKYYTLILVTEVNSQFPKLYKYNPYQISKMKRFVQHYKFVA